MIKRIALMLAAGLIVFAQDDADIPTKFRNRISPEVYHQLRNAHVDTLRGLPAAPGLREAAITMRNLQIQQRATLTPGAGPSVVLVPS